MTSMNKICVCLKNMYIHLDNPGNGDADLEYENVQCDDDYLEEIIFSKSKEKTFKIEYFY